VSVDSRRRVTDGQVT